MVGEGVVAIVQGLYDAGLAVTLLNGRLLTNKNSHRRPFTSKSSVETNTDKTYRNYYKINKGIHISDGHYSSSYQISHCNARPTSPPQSSPGFPPQRLKPSRTEGNFELGWCYGACDTSTLPSQGYGSVIGRCDRSIDTVSMYTNRGDSQSHETFAHSLRRYPYSPERSISSELVQKLLSYTQNKYLTKLTSKSKRSLNRGRSPQTSRYDVKKSKQIQTYSRTKREYRTRDCGANTSHDLKFPINKKGRCFSTFKGKRYKDDNNTSYDYLESPATSRHSRHTNEVRYVRDVKKYIRDTIAQIYNDEPMVCPNIKARYSQHKKLYHKNQTPSRSAEVQASVPTTSRTAFTNCCGPPSGSHYYLPDANVSTFDILCGRCYKPKPCTCKLKADKTAAAVKQITDWVDELPTFAENTRKNKRRKEKIIKDLLDIISKIPKDDNYFDNIKNEITSYIEKLSIWDPDDEEVNEGNKIEVTDNLVERLKTLEDKILAAVKDVIRKWLDDLPLDRNINMDKTATDFATYLTPLLKDVGQLKSKLKELLINLPITHNEEVIDDVSNDIVNNLIELSDRSDRPVLTEQELENEINEFIETYPDIDNIDHGNKVKNLARKLNNAQRIPLSDREKEQKIKGNVDDWIDTLPRTARESLSPKQKEEFSDDLVEKIKNATDLKKIAKDKKTPLHIENEIENEIWDLLESMGIDQNDVDKSLVEGFAMKLKEMIKSDFDEEDFANESIDFLSELDKSGVLVKSKDQDTLYKNVLEKLKTIKSKDEQSGDSRQSSFATSRPTEISPLQTLNEIENEIWGLLESMDIDRNDVDESIVKGYAMKLKDINTSDFVEEDVANESNDLLNEFDKSGAPMELKDQDKFHKKVNDKLKKIEAKDKQGGGGRQSSFASSTPKKGKSLPNKGFNATSIDEGDDFNYSIASPPDLKNAEKQYNNDLNKQIESWVETLPINLDLEKSTKNTIVNDLANDIMDRQKYLQIHPNTAKSDDDELENLKYQVFRWLNKMDKVKDHEMAAVIDKAQNLIDKIKNIDVPRFDKSYARSPFGEKSFGSQSGKKIVRSPMKEKIVESQAEKKVFGSPTKDKRFGSPNREKIRSSINEQSLKSPTKEIYGSPTRYESFGSQIGEKNVVLPAKEKKIGSPARDKTTFSPPAQKSTGSSSRESSLVSPNRENTIGSPTRDQSLVSVYRQKSDGSPAKEKPFEASSREKNSESPIKKLSLGSATGEKNFRSPTQERNYDSATGEQSFYNKTYIPTQNASMFIKENLDGAISNWVKQLPLYVKGSPEQKRKFDNVVPELSKAIKRVFDNIDNLQQDIDELVKDEIEKQMKNFPLSSEDYNDRKIINQAAAQLLQHLKDQQMFQDISERTDVAQDEYLNQYVDDWANLLSLRQLNSPDTKEFENLKKEFAYKLKQAREDRVDDDTLKSEIRKYLKKLPLKDTVRKNLEYQDRKVEELFKALSTLPAAIASRNIPDIRHFVRQAVAKWIQKLPLDKGKTVSDIPEHAIKNTVDKISNLMTMSDKIPLKELKKTVEDATVKLLDQVPLDPKKTRDVKALTEDLHKHVVDIPKKNIKDIRTSYGRPSKEDSKDDEPVTLNDLKATVEDNLSGAILDWIKQKPDYLDKKAEYDILASNLTKTIKTTLNNSKGKDQDKVIIDEMTKQFKNTPLNSKNPGEATQALQDLKELQMLQKNSDTTIPNNVKDFENIVDNFGKNNLNLIKVTWPEKIKFGELKSELVSKLKELINDRADRDAIKNEIKNYLSRFPISEDERRDDHFLDKKAEELLDSLLINENISPDINSYVRKSFMKWMKNVPLEKGKTINEIPKEVIDQIARRLSDLIIHSDVVAISDIQKTIDQATIKFLQISPLDRNISYDPKQLAKDLFDSIKGAAEGKIQTSSKNNTLEVSVPRSSRASVPTSAKTSGPRSSKEKNTETLVPKSSSQEKTTNVSVLTSTETLLSHKSESTHPSLKSAANQLAENIEQWVNNLPIKEDTPEEKSKVSNLRRHLTSRIISKVSELNTNPEIFNDDFLYEEMFEDEVDNIITSLSNEDLKKYILAHKKSLIDIVKDGRLKTLEEMAGTVYKQQLRDVVSKNVPSESLTENENASFEVLKEDVADAFVSLHYVRSERGDTESKSLFKNNVKNKIDEFCRDYLKLHQNTVVDAEKLKSDLYKALKGVPIPNNDTMRHEIEIIRNKDMINQWIDESKLLGNQTGVERLKTKKKISVLAKKIHEIEKLKESNSDFDTNDMLKKEIVKWLQKLPLIVKDNLNILAEELIRKLKETEELRKSLRSYSSGKESTLPASSYFNGPWSSPLNSDSPPRCCSTLISSTLKPTTPSKVLRQSEPHGICKVPKVSERTNATTETTSTPEFTIIPSPCAPPCAIPPSTLSSEDREYLKKIRERATQSKQQRPHKDAAVDPVPVDYSSQTKITTDITTTTPQAQSTPLQAQTSNQKPSPFETSKPGMQTAGSQVEVVPHVMIKEYYWDSIDSKMSPCSRNYTCPTSPCPLIPGVTCSSRPSFSCTNRSSQHAQTAPPSPQDCNPDCSYYLPDLSQPCKSNSKRCNKSNHNVGSCIKGSNRNLAWSKENVYGDTREPHEEEDIIKDMSRRRKHSCRCKDRVTNISTKKHECKSCTAHDKSLNRCPKCCGVHCPYPSYLYFKQ